MVSIMFLSVIFLISRTCDNNGCIYQRLWYRWIAIKVCSCAPAFTFVPTPLAGATTNGLLISQILRKSAQLFEFYCSQYIVSLPATIRQITSYGQFRQATSENTFIQGQEIAAHCECWLLCAIQILLLTYLLTNRETNKPQWKQHPRQKWWRQSTTCARYADNITAGSPSNSLEVSFTRDRNEDAVVTSSITPAFCRVGCWLASVLDFTWPEYVAGGCRLDSPYLIRYSTRCRRNRPNIVRAPGGDISGRAGAACASRTRRID